MANSGAGEFVVIGAGAASVLTIGGRGRDVLINTSVGGVVWGDVLNSYRRRSDEAANGNALAGRIAA